MNYTPEFLLNLYRMMLRIRLCEEALVEPILSGQIRCPVHLYSGEEAIAAGVCAALEGKDMVFGNHRSHGHYLAKGGSMHALFAEIFGRQTGCSRGRGGSMHIISPENGVLGIAPIVAGTISLALGAALASSIKNDLRVTVSFFGDGATGEGVLFESLNFAALKKLPLIFICENNSYSTHLPIREIRANNDIHLIAEPFGITHNKYDGNVVLQVYESARNAVELCRNGLGPVFLEFNTYRFRGHVGPDDNVQGAHTDIRPEDEIDAWRKKDPVLCFEKSLMQDNILTAELRQEIQASVDKEVKENFAKALSDPMVPPDELLKYVYAE